MGALSVKNLNKRYTMARGTKLTVLDGISFSIKHGEFLGIIGPNGCGKTTLLKLVLGIERPNEGSISIFGDTPEEVHVGYVPQHTVGSLYPWFTALENIQFADPKADAMQRLDGFGISQYANSYPYEMSGGIKQLVSIARAANLSNVFLFDEPFNALDYQNRRLVEDAFLNLRDGKNSSVLVSHDIESMVLLCDKIIVLTEKPSRIKAFVPVNLPKKRTLETRRTPHFSRALNQVFEILDG
jgi:NitT/TauT family transport system ATP-binding protein